MVTRQDRGPVSELTPRDLQVAKLVAQGNERNDVAVALGTSRSDVNRSMGKVITLTDSANGLQALAKLVALGLLSPTDVMGAGPQERNRFARRIAPGVHRTGQVITSKDVATWLRDQRIPRPLGEAEEHVNSVLDDMADEWMART